MYLYDGCVNVYLSCFRLLADSSSNQFIFWQEYADARYAMKLILNHSF